MKSVVFLATMALMLLHSSSAFVVPHGRSLLGHRSTARHTARSCPREQRQHAAWLVKSTGSVEESEMNALDRALVAWGVKSPPGEPEIDFKEKIKSAGLAGALAYGSTELAFWIISVPLAIFSYYRATGEWLDLTTLEGKEKLFGLTAGFLTFARLVVPLRIALALALTPAMDKYVVKAFLKPGEASAEPAVAAYESETAAAAPAIEGPDAEP